MAGVCCNQISKADEIRATEKFCKPAESFMKCSLIEFVLAFQIAFGQIRKSLEIKAVVVFVFIIAMRNTSVDQSLWESAVET